MSETTLPPAGWYPHSSQPGAQRYWDGRQWTDHVQPGGPSHPPPSQKKPKAKNTLGTVALIFAVIGFIFACIPGALIIGWILLPIAFILSLVALFQSGPKWSAITGLIITVVGTIVGFVVFFVVVADAVSDSVDEAFNAEDGEYAVTVDSVRQAADYEGKPALVVDFTFTNNSDEPVNFLFAVTATAFQNGVELEDAILDDSQSDNSMKDIKPGTSVVVQEAFILADGTDVTIEVTEAFDFDETVLVSKTVPVQASKGEVFGEAHSEYEVSIDGSRQVQDYEGKPALVVDFTFTNNGDDAESFVFAVSAKAFQNGVELEDAYLMESDSGDAMREIKPGKSIVVQQAFLLRNGSDATIEVSENFDLDEATLAIKTIRIR